MAFISTFRQGLRYSPSDYGLGYPYTQFRFGTWSSQDGLRTSAFIDMLLSPIAFPKGLVG